MAIYQKYFEDTRFGIIISVCGNTERRSVGKERLQRDQNPKCYDPGQSWIKKSMRLSIALVLELLLIQGNWTTQL